MLFPRIRILLVTEEKSLAETVQRGLSAISEVRPEVEVTLSADHARELVSERDYRLLVLASGNGTSEAEDLVAELPDGQAVVTVGGSPNGTNGIHRRVPLPLSYNLLRAAVLEAIRDDGEPDEGLPRFRDSVGS